ncbi:DUF6238 family protein [Streptomyces sp. RS10V-4]|uniref:DUF6238 family protein n=1 Tax=Streptomyces rhizoryzae TaxID=2932493 RepID=UPI002004A16F|nr:DUF6238 family protein [Streptomyces rhizoryzae]MCK7626180.1 DUF6238 family protein [Streptomyces rhizoryzae]
MPSHPEPEPASDFVPFATAALDFHRAINLPDDSHAASRIELDALHAHLTSLYGLIDAHTTLTAPVAKAEGDHLRACRVRLWQATEHLHAAYHAAPRPASSPEARRARLPEGAPDLTVCRRHLTTAARVRRSHTPTDLRDPFTGLIRH